MARKGVKYQTWDVKCMKEGQRLFVKNLDNKGCELTINFLFIASSHEGKLPIWKPGLQESFWKINCYSRIIGSYS